MRKRALGTFIILMMLVFIMSLLPLDKPGSLFAAELEIIGSEDVISIISESPLFDMENMAPGDMATATVALKNESKAPFSLTLTAMVESGDRVLVDHMMFSVNEVSEKSKTKVYYEGQIGEFRNIDLGTIAQGKDQAYVLCVTFLPEAGNDLQGKSISLKYEISANKPGNGPFPDDEDVDNGDTIDIGDEEIPQSGIPVTGEISSKSSMGSLMMVVALLLLVLEMSGRLFSRFGAVRPVKRTF